MDIDHAYARPVALVFAVLWKAASILNAPVLNPLVTGVFLYLLSLSPHSIRITLASRLRQHLGPIAITRVITTLRWMFAIGVARKLHLWLNILAQNNMRLKNDKLKYQWSQEIAVVTGAAGGFGSLIARDLTAQGIHVIAVDVADEMPESIKGDPKIYYHKCDITRRDAVMQLAEHIKLEHGTPSILVNNAGLAFNHSLLNATESAINQTYGVNIISHYWTLQAFLPGMIAEKKGHVVAIASMASFMGTASIGPYCQTKAAVLSLHETLSQELRVIYGAPEIKLSIVHPTFAKTRMTRAFEKDLASKATLIEPQEVSDAVLRQITSGQGGQVMIAGSLGSIPSLLRCLPPWLTFALLRSSEGKVMRHDVAEQPCV